MRVKLVALLVILMAGKSIQAQVLSADAIAYINTYKSLAIAEMQRSGIPASIILAQGIHESESGTSDLVRRSNNHFGIKCKDDWKGATVYHDDDARGECFRSYPTPQDSYKDHSDFLVNGSRYAFLFKLDPTDYEGWAYGLRKAGYATNIKYSQLLIKLIKDYNLQQYTLIAIGKMKPSDELVLTAPGAATDRIPVKMVMNGGDSGNPTEYASGKSQGSVKGASNTLPAPAYPVGEFSINKTKVIFVKAGASLLAIAEQYELPLSRLMDFNDMKEEDVVVKDQLLFLQRKRRTGANEFHIVRLGESLYDISQAEGVRYQDVLEMNQLSAGVQPAEGEKIWLQGSSPARPRLADAAIRQGDPNSGGGNIYRN
jgi:LysM repeat protein